MTVRVTSHAIERGMERCGYRTKAEAVAALTSPVILKAAEFGAPYVKLGTGQHVVLEGWTVVTVLPKGQRLGCMSFDRGVLRRRFG